MEDNGGNSYGPGYSTLYQGGDGHVDFRPPQEQSGQYYPPHQG